MMNTEDYIASLEGAQKEYCEQIRSIISKIVPEAKETWKYGLPTFDLQGNLVHFAASKNHLGFYPGASGVKNFEDRLGEYNFSKGAIQFPYTKKLPIKLIQDIVKFRKKENLEKAAAKKKK